MPEEHNILHRDAVSYIWAYERFECTFIKPNKLSHFVDTPFWHDAIDIISSSSQSLAIFCVHLVIPKCLSKFTA